MENLKCHDKRVRSLRSLNYNNNKIFFLSLNITCISFPLSLDVEMGEWQEQSDSSRLRDLTYTLALNYSFGPKFTHTSEHQIYSKSGQPGLKHIVDTEVR